MNRSKIIEEMATDTEGSGVEAEMEGFDAIEPFDPASISLSSKVVALDAVLRRIKNDTIKLAPDFQRNYVWDIERKSRLIESMMLRIPLPMFYVSEDRHGVWEVVDGLQRLTTIRDFLLGEDGDGKGFSLKGLEFWGAHLDGRTFFEIERKLTLPRIVNNVMEAELSFTIINPDTPEKVKRNIFKRINTGGMPLSIQEIRHALYQGPATNFLRDAISKPAYKRILGRTVKDTRMAGRELVLRFVAFHLRGWEAFRGDMDSFLSDTMRFMNGELKLKDVQWANEDVLMEDFRRGLLSAHELFGDHVFRRSHPPYRKTPINKSLFDVLMYVCARMSAETLENIRSQRDSFNQSFQELVSRDETFGDALGRYGSDLRGVKTRYTKVLQLVERYRRD